MESKEKYIAFLRGINVGGRHKVSMTELQSELKKINLKNITTLLNSGNVLFESNEDDLGNKISAHLEKAFGFSIPIIIRKSAVIIDMLRDNPFKDVKITKDTRLYVSFLKNEVNNELKLPWKRSDLSHEIIMKSGSTIFSVVDVSISETTVAMKTLEKYYGKEITTRNWNTIIQVGKKTSA